MKLVGTLSAPGIRIFGLALRGYGHLGQYEGEISVTALKDMIRRASCSK